MEEIKNQSRHYFYVEGVFEARDFASGFLIIKFMYAMHIDKTEDKWYNLNSLGS